MEMKERCIDVINCFKLLQDSLAVVAQHVCILDRDLPAWFSPPVNLPINKNDSLRQQVCDFLRQLEYLNDQKPREALVGAGIVASSIETIDAIKKLNLVKNNFKQAMLKLKEAKIATSNQLLSQNIEQLLPQLDINLATISGRMGFSRLHLKQCYRKIPCLSKRPDRVSWTWANTRAIKKISVHIAEQLLLKSLLKHPGNTDIEQQLKKLQDLNPNEKLAIIQDLAPHLRANIFMQNNNIKAMVAGSVPIFYLDACGIGLPKHTEPRVKHGKDKNRRIRKDTKINSEPFLSAIHAHRYLEHTR